MSSNIKHSKFKNTYLMYEFLVRQVMSDVMFGKTRLTESKAFGIINKYFNNKSALAEELRIYNAMINSKFNQVGKTGADFSANYLINECLKRHESLSQKELRTSKYNLVKEIKESYDIEKLFSTPVPTYREGATVYALLEANRIKSPVDKARFSGLIFEHITKPKKIVENTNFKADVFKNASKDEVNLAFNILVKNFNKTHGSVLTENQKKLIQDYVYSTTNESNWINEHFTKARLLLNKKIKSLTGETKQDKQVVKLKLQECESKLSRMSKEKNIHNQDLILNKIMAVYSLIEMVDNV